jgi:hypothetical protein
MRESSPAAEERKSRQDKGGSIAKELMEWRHLAKFKEFPSKETEKSLYVY